MLHTFPAYLTNKESQDHNKLLEALAQHPEDALMLHKLLMFACFPGVDHEQCKKSCDYVMLHSKDKEQLFWAYHFKGCVLEHQKKYEEAVPLLKTAIDLDTEGEATFYAI